jgi:4-amino-4-deoxy-L-arabinose transferase-like glycosyltransferase
VEGAALRPRPAASGLAASLRSHWWIAGAITLLAAVLRLKGIAATHTDPYYDAAVRSMGASWHNFFFAAFEPGGSVAVDKPPVDLWLQVVSTKLFGLGSTGLLLPVALAGTAAVPLLYDLVRRPFGILAGAAAALALAVMPASVLTSRSDTMDSLMMAMTVLAAWLVMLSVRRGRARWLYVAAAVAGLAFEVKLLEALVALPALLVLYLLASPDPGRRRAMHVGIAALAYLAAALWWPVAVSLAPGGKPFPIGSTDGSVWSSTFVFNGSDRISPPPPPPTRGHRHRHHKLRVGHRTVVVHHRKRSLHTAPGPARLLDPGGSRYGTLVGSELVAAVALALLAVALALLERRRFGAAPEDRMRRGLALSLGAWLVPGVVLYSTVHELHPRYLEAISPAIAGVIGVALAALVSAAARGGLGALALVLGLSAPAAYVSWSSAQGTAEAVAAVLAGAGAALALGFGAAAGTRSAAGRSALTVAACLALVSIAAPPTARSAAIVRGNSTDSGRPGAMSPRELDRLSAYLAPRTRGMRYELVSASYQKVAPLIVKDGRPVLIATSVQQRPLVTIARLRREIAAGHVRYVLFANECGSDNPLAVSHCVGVLRWLRAQSTDVSRAAGLGTSGVLFRIR